MSPFTNQTFPVGADSNNQPPPRPNDPSVPSKVGATDPASGLNSTAVVDKTTSLNNATATSQQRSGADLEAGSHNPAARDHGGAPGNLDAFVPERLERLGQAKDMEGIERALK